jgi:prepilin-type N-terminal cleavage/methylation domain-containing protein
MSDERGFTLIELLVVMIIIGVLLGFAVPAYLGFKDKAQKAAGAADVREAVPSAEAYYGDNNYSYAGLSVATLKSYDSGLSSQIVTVAAGPTHYCISSHVGTWYSHVVGPGGTVVPDDSSDFCAGWTPS